MTHRLSSCGMHTCPQLPPKILAMALQMWSTLQHGCMLLECTHLPQLTWMFLSCWTVLEQS